MKANPDKFQAIAIGKNTHSKNIFLNLNGNIINISFMKMLKSTGPKIDVCGTPL
jgi:hypothetical protein